MAVMTSNHGTAASNSGCGCRESSSSHVEVTLGEQDRKCNLAMDRYLDEKDGYQQFLVTGRRDKTQHTAEKAEEAVRQANKWDETSREPAANANTASP